MLIAYILAPLLALALIALYIIWSRARGKRPDNRPAPSAAETPARPAPPPPLAKWADDGDPQATLIHRHTSHAAPPAHQKRDGATPATASARLVGLSGSRKDVSYPVVASGITIGRSDSCDVVLADHRVSSRHAWIGIVDGKFVLRDLKSTNGTFINTQTQSAVGEIELRAGDTILFGSHQGDQFRFLAD